MRHGITGRGLLALSLFLGVVPAAECQTAALAFLEDTSSLSPEARRALALSADLPDLFKRLRRLERQLENLQGEKS